VVRRRSIRACPDRTGKAPSRLARPGKVSREWAVSSNWDVGSSAHSWTTSLLHVVGSAQSRRKQTKLFLHLRPQYAGKGAPRSSSPSSPGRTCWTTGIAPLTDAERRDFLEVIDDRHGTRSTLLAGQLPVSHWHEWIGDPTSADGHLRSPGAHRPSAHVDGRLPAEAAVPLTPTRRPIPINLDGHRGRAAAGPASDPSYGEGPLEHGGARCGDCRAA